MIDTRTDHYNLVGWLSIISGILLIPEIGLAVALGFVSFDIYAFVTPLHIFNLAIVTFVLFMFRGLLHHQFNFHRADILITLLIIFNIIFFIIGILELATYTRELNLDAEPLLSIVDKVLYIPFGLLTITFGVVLLKLNDDLFGLLKPYVFATVGSGVFGATLILAPVGKLAAVAAYVTLGMIFLRAKREADFL
jgi:hypothetical protein